MRRANHIKFGIITDVQRFLRRGSKPRTRRVEDACIGFASAMLTRAKCEYEAMLQADQAKIGIAIGQRGQRCVIGEPVERRLDIGIQFDAIAGDVERVERRFYEIGFMPTFGEDLR